MPSVGQQNIIPGTAPQTIKEGHHDGTGEVAGDADLTSGNIVNGVRIFDVTGSYECPFDCIGTAGAGDVLAGRTFVQPNSYWSSTTDTTDPDWAWRVLLDDGLTNSDHKGKDYYVWPVRAGQ